MQNAIGKIIVAVTLCVTWSFSFGDDSIPSLDLLMASVDSSASTDSSAVPDSAITADSTAADSAVAPTAPAVSAPVKEAPPSAPLKTILYLGGGERSPWFQLGVLYAIEEYSIPIDSIVATSWGTWVGALWAKGVPLDEIQKRMLDSAISPFVGHNLSSPDNRLGFTEKDSFEWPISIDGKPSIRQRFNIFLDSAEGIRRVKHALQPDSTQVTRALAKLRFQESLYRERGTYKIPFTVLGCNNSRATLIGNTIEDVIASLPLWNDHSDKSGKPIPGELCPYQAFPIEDNIAELPIIVISDPLRQEITGDAHTVLLKQQALATVASQPGIIIRAHTILDTARSSWIQAGFSAFEKRLSDFKALNGRRTAYSTDHQAALPWFRFETAFDSLSPTAHNAVKAYWDKSDTGLTAPQNFAERLLQFPAYDSLDLNMLPSGNLQIESSIHPTIDIAAGGFGSNAFGPNAFAEATLYYVERAEIKLTLEGFYGMTSYGFQPRLELSKLWNRHWGLSLGYDFLDLSPLKSYNSNIPRSQRILTEHRNDLTMSLSYEIDKHQKLSTEFLFGTRTFTLDSLSFRNTEIKTYPVSPVLHYQLLDGEKDPWFAENGYEMNIFGGMESIGFNDELPDVIPIYWKIFGDARYTISPTRFTTFTLGAAGVIERYHDEGHGYVTPKSFNYAPLDIAYQSHAAATPWTTEWYNVELSSHEYTLVRSNIGLHLSNIGAWIFAAYFHDFQESPFAELNVDKFVIEPALHFSYRSLTAYIGMNRIVDSDTYDLLKKFKDYTYFVRIGNYHF